MRSSEPTASLGVSNRSLKNLIKKIGIHPLFLYSIIAIICTYPLAFTFNRLFGPASDNQLFIWNFWWFKHAIFELHTNPFYTNYLFWPEGISLFFRISPPPKWISGTIIVTSIWNVRRVQFLNPIDLYTGRI